VFDYMAAGRPTVLAIDGVIRKVVEDAGGGAFVEPGNAAELTRVIVSIADDPARAKQMGKNARAWVVQNYCRDEQAKELQEFISMIAGQRPASGRKSIQPAAEEIIR